MREKGYALSSDFKETWAAAARDRELKRLGKHVDPDLKKDITEQVMREVARSD
jgi:hypothetical protein